jgi:hypothetical protein
MMKKHIYEELLLLKISINYITPEMIIPVPAKAETGIYP